MNTVRNKRKAYQEKVSCHLKKESKEPRDPIPLVVVQSSCAGNSKDGWLAGQFDTQTLRTVYLAVVYLTAEYCTLVWLYIYSFNFRIFFTYFKLPRIV
jgi:hypothetical protein